MHPERELSAALSHPARVRILAHLRAREVASPTELATALRLPLGNVSYHVRRLDQLGLVALVERRAPRGTVEHRYALAPATAGALDVFARMRALEAAGPHDPRAM